MKKLWARFLGRPCEHKHLLVVTSVGVRRSICEDCGHISFTIREPVQRTTPASVARTDPDLSRVEGF